MNAKKIVAATVHFKGLHLLRMWDHISLQSPQETLECPWALETLATLCPAGARDEDVPVVIRPYHS